MVDFFLGPQSAHVFGDYFERTSDLTHTFLQRGCMSNQTRHKPPLLKPHTVQINSMVDTHVTSIHTFHTNYKCNPCSM